MHAHNVSQGVPTVEIDKARELAFYDALPERWRRLVDSLPIPQRVETIQGYRVQLGDVIAFAKIIDIFTQKFPGWTPPYREVSPALDVLNASSKRRRRPRRGEITVPATEEGVR